MSKALRLSEKWFRRGLWLVALVFASFLIGLGGTIVGDLPKVETPLQVDDFLDKAAGPRAARTIKEAAQAEQDAQTALEQAQLQRRKARSDNQAERETFNNWLATRSVTAARRARPRGAGAHPRARPAQAGRAQALRRWRQQQQAALDARQAAAPRSSS
jgi:hypothetical protein